MSGKPQTKFKEKRTIKKKKKKMKLEDGGHEGKCKEALGVTAAGKPVAACAPHSQRKAARYLSFSM